MIQSWDQTPTLLFPSKAFCSLGLSLRVCKVGAIPAAEDPIQRVLRVDGIQCHCSVPLPSSYPHLLTQMFGAPGLTSGFFL